MSEHTSKETVEKLGEVSRKLVQIRDEVAELLSRGRVGAVESTMIASGIKANEAFEMAGELHRQRGGMGESMEMAIITVSGSIQTINESARRINRATNSSGSVTFRWVG